MNNRIWTSQDGYFLPFNFEISKDAEKVISILKRMTIPPDQSIYLRGSYLECDKLFPCSDIDICVVGDNADEQVIGQIKSNLGFTNRAIEILCLSEAEISKRPTYRLLLHTRALLVNGQKIIFEPVKADLETMRDHLFHYKPLMMAPDLSKNKNIRITQLKRITRSYGVLHFLHKNQFSRDIETCTLWAKAINETAGNFLKEMWAKADFPSTYNCDDLSMIKTAFIRDSKIAFDFYLKNNKN